MNLPPADHPIWIFLRNSLLVVVLFMCFYFGYNSFDPIKDPRSIIIVVIAGLSFDIFKRFTAPPAAPPTA